MIPLTEKLKELRGEIIAVELTPSFFDLHHYHVRRTYSNGETKSVGMFATVECAATTAVYHAPRSNAKRRMFMTVLDVNNGKEYSWQEIDELAEQRPIDLWTGKAIQLVSKNDYKGLVNRA